MKYLLAVVISSALNRHAVSAEGWSCGCGGCSGWTSDTCTSADAACTSEGGTPSQTCTAGDSSYTCVAYDDYCGTDTSCEQYCASFSCSTYDYSCRSGWECECNQCSGWTDVDCLGANVTCRSEGGEPQQACEAGDTQFVCTDASDSCDDGSDCSAYCSAFNCAGHVYTCSNQDGDITDSGGANDCLHIDSEVSYKGTMYSYADFLGGAVPECVVPHTVSRRGLSIATDCGRPLRVTRTHLLMTTEGYVSAETLVVGRHSVLGGSGAGDTCAVTGIDVETVSQQYFGLNCIQSEVSANGLRVSTFGDYHAVPAWYMYIVGSVFGVRTASRLGDALAGGFYRLLGVANF